MRPTALPNSAQMLATAQAQGWSALDVNKQITQGYGQLARAIQSIVAPGFSAAGDKGARVLPNWFAFAPHASRQVGAGLFSASLGARIVALMRAGKDPEEAFRRATASQKLPSVLNALVAVLVRTGAPRTVARALAVLLSSSNDVALKDPRVLVAVAWRGYQLFKRAPGVSDLDKAEAVFRTMTDTLTQGNRSIYGDVGGSAESYLEFRQAAAPVTPDKVLDGLRLAGSTPAQARAVYNFALAHAADERPPFEFDQVLPGVDTNSMMVAGFALYERAAAERDLTRKNELIAFANNLLAFREQYVAVAPAFDPKSTQPGEVDRGLLMSALTPLVEVGEGDHKRWTYARYVEDHAKFSPRPPLLDHNWAKFSDRWPAIQSFFGEVYKSPASLWETPPPLPD
jgi:hypothetical protein